MQEEPPVRLMLDWSAFQANGLSASENVKDGKDNLNSRLLVS